MTAGHFEPCGNLDEIFAHRRAEIQNADQHEELRRRVEEDKKIQAAEMKGDGKSAPSDEKGAKE